MSCFGINSARATSCRLYTSRHRSGIKFLPMTYLLFDGFYGEDGTLYRGTEGEAARGPVNIPARFVPAPKNCCGQIGIS